MCVSYSDYKDTKRVLHLLTYLECLNSMKRQHKILSLHTFE